MAILQEGVSAAESWSALNFNGDVRLWQDCLGLVKYVAHLGKKKLGHYAQIPYLLASLDLPNVRDEALCQYSSAPRELHNRVSINFLDPSGLFYSDVMDMRSDGSGMSFRLQAAVL